MVKVGVLIKRPESLFTNGCVQQALFIHKMLNMIDNCQCTFVTIEKNYELYDKSIPLKVFPLYEDEIKTYDIILMVSLTLSDNINKDILQKIKNYNVKLIDILCGNLYILLQEEFVFNTHNIMKNYNNSYIDEVWVLEMYEYSRNYLDLIYNVPVKVLPYVWDVDIIKSYIKKENIQLKNNLNNERVNICIYEPNMSIHKNALVPLLIAERFYKRYPNRLNKVYLFCKEKINNNGYYEKMNIFKDNRVEMYGRVIMPFTLKLIEENNDFKTIVLSYTMMNNLNFLHLELFYLGKQIVHNCEPFDNGLFYDSFDVCKAVDLLEEARTINVDKKKCVDIICKYNPRNLDIQNKWNDEINRLLN